MSCDFAVWHTDAPLSDSQAQEMYGRLCDGDASGVVPFAGIGAFYEELTVKHPEIDDLTLEQASDTELCPWSIGFNRSDGHVVMCCAWSRAEYVGRLLATLAAKHGLAFYDPQEGTVRYPRQEAGKRR
jgi:hypothetical protein